MKCPKCQKEVYDDAKFCPHCGISLDSQCPRCGYTVSTSDRFCANCGQELKKPKVDDNIGGYYVPIHQQKEEYVQPDYSSMSDNDMKEDYINQDNTYYEVDKKKDKVKWKSIIIALVVVLLLFAGSFIYLMDNKDNTNTNNTQQQIEKNTPDVTIANNYSTYVGNVNLEGKAIIDDDTIYMTNDKGYLVSFDKKFEESRVLLEESVSYITVYNDKIYFADANNYLSVVDKDGKNKEILLSQAVYYLVLKDDSLYYQLDPDGESLYVMDLKTRKSTKLNNCRTYSPNISDDAIYYSSGDGIYKMNKDGNEDTRIIEGKVYNLLYEDNKLYYISDYTLTIYNLETKETETISNLRMSMYNKSGKTIYAFTTSGLVSYDIESKETKVIYAGNVDSFQIIGNVVLMQYNDNWTVIDSQGNQFSLFEEESGDFI